jgi:predicted Zn-dependent protease
VVALTFYEDEIMGVVSTSEGNFNISKEKTSGKHLIFHENNLKDESHLDCGTHDHAEDWDEHSGYEPEVLLQPYAAGNPGKYARLYIETEYDIYQALGSTTGVEAHISAVLNQVRTLFHNESVATVLQQIYVWTTTDPYTTTASDTLLTQFENTRTSISGSDLGMLLTFRGNSSGMAYVSGPCYSNTKYKLGVSLINQAYSNFPIYSRTVKVITHEFGHLLGSKHTHACVWNGNNTAIDGCYDVEGSCTKPTVPVNGGTIMSYCDHSSTLPGINFSLGFGQQPGNVIRNTVSNASCLPSVSISSNSATRLLCASGGSITCTVSNAPGGYSWNQSSNLTAGTTSGSSKSFTAKSGSSNYGPGWIAIYVGPAEIARYNVYVGAPSVVNISGNRNVPNMQYATFYAETPAYSTPTSYQWILNPQLNNNLYGANTSILDIAFYTAGSYQLVCRATNSCGQGEYTVTGVTVYNASTYSLPYPNPASDVLTVGFNPELVTQAKASLQSQAGGKTIKRAFLLTVKLYDSTGILQRQTTSTGEDITLDVANLENGLYILHVHDGLADEPETHKILISH